MQLRLPLQTGATAFSEITRWPAWIIGGTSVAAVADACQQGIAAPRPLVIAMQVALLLSLAVTVSPLAVLAELAFLARQVRSAVRKRGCDVILSPDALELRGGPRHGLRVPLADVDGDRSAVVDGSLVLARRSGVCLALAEASDPEELRSFEALLATLRGLAAPRPAPASGVSAHVLDCSSCGAPVTPADAAEVACGSCGGAVSMGDAVREQLRAARVAGASRAASDRAVERLVRQPSATWANLVVLSCAATVLLLWPTNGLFALVGIAGIGREPYGWMACLTLAMLLVALSVARAVLADRWALRLLTLGFAAHAPAARCEPSRCRVCSGPLPAAPDGGVVTRCIFCSAANLLGLDVRADAVEARSSERELLGALAEQRKARRRRLLAVAAALGLSAVGWTGFRSASQREAERAADLPTCADLDDAPGEPLAAPERVARSPFAPPAYVVVDRPEAPEWARQRLMRGELAVASGADIEAPAVSPDGTHVLFGHRFARSGNYGLEALVGDRTEGVHTVARSPRFAAFSPDGAWISFSGIVASSRQLLVAPLATPSQTRAVVCDGGEVTVSAWSPDGGALAFVLATKLDEERYGPGDLWTVRLDGRQPRRRTDGDRVLVERILWDRDGCVYFHTAAGVERVAAR